MRQITKIKINYYSKEALKYILLAGAIYIAASSPYFVLNLTRNINRFKNYKKKPLGSAFDYLKRRGLIAIKKDGHDIKIVLTKEGKKRAGKYQIDDLKIEKPRKWDGKWRIVIFDIPHLKTTERNAFRRKLKELGFYSLQKSVWAHPFECREEISLLREFFGLGKGRIQVLLVEKIENDKPLKEFFKL